MTDKARPVPTPETAYFWEKAAQNQLWIQRCTTTGKHFFHPRRYSPFVAGGAVEWVKATGRATLYSYTIVHKPAPGFEHEAPYAMAVGQLVEGPRLMGNVRDIPNTPEELVLDMALQVAFEKRGQMMVPVFEKAAP